MLLRPSVDTDIAAITAIYGHYVMESTATFELDVPVEDEIRSRRAKVLALGLPYIVAEIDGRVVGYAYAGEYRPRKAYRFTVEHSIYLAAEARGRGVGRALLEALIARCTELGYRQMLAVIGGADNTASIGLHSAMGFAHVGRLPAVGYKFGRWADSVLMQRALGAGSSPDPEEPKR